MNFMQSPDNAFRPRVQVSPASRRGKSRLPRHRCVLRLESLEDRLAPATLIVNSLADNTTSGDHLLTLREAIQSINQGHLVDSSVSGQVTGSFGSKDTIQFAPR